MRRVEGLKAAYLSSQLAAIGSVEDRILADSCLVSTTPTVRIAAAMT